jgi:hypothetical protein
MSAVVLIGCVSAPLVQTKTAAPGAQPAAADSGWWYARFRVEWPENADPFWHMDLLIAHVIVKPSLERHQQDISLWRFHRRAARDNAGHQFSFIFYASPGTAQSIYDELSAHPVIQETKASGRIMDFMYDNTERVLKPGVADTSDPNWPAHLRHAWPYYLMGASQMWLDLISSVLSGEQVPEAIADLRELENRYAKASASINAIWQHEGRHAFLHHLNALFGYEPLVIIEKRQMRF